MSAAERVYSIAPVWLQHGLVSMQGLNFRLRRASTRIMRQELATLRESQHWPEERLRALQSERLRQMVAAAFADVPYYRDLASRLGCQAADFRTAEDLRALPVLEKSDLRGSEERFVSAAYRRSSLYVNRTSGTTGTPLRTFESRESFSRRWGFVARLREWAGVADPVYPRRAQFTGREIVPGGRAAGDGPFWRRNLAGNALLFSTSHLSVATVPAYAAALLAFRPDVVEGYPSAIDLVAGLSVRLGVDLPRPAAVITSAETLHPDQRDRISRAFGCPVFNQYASSEPSCFWATCEEGVLHQSPEYGISEILDDGGGPAAPGEAGSVVVTGLINPVMPLLRYRLGDTAVAGPLERCACGREFPRVERVMGRDDDVLYLPERGYVGRLDPVFKGLSGVLEAQVVQESLAMLAVSVVVDGDSDPSLEGRLIGRMREKVGGEVEIRVRRVSRIARDANGKFRSVVSHVRHLYPDDPARGSLPGPSRGGRGAE